MLREEQSVSENSPYSIVLHRHNTTPTCQLAPSMLLFCTHFVVLANELEDGDLVVLRELVL